MQKLTARQERVLHLRFGHRPVSQRHIAQLLGTSLRGVQQIEHRALRRLRLGADSQVYTDLCGWDEA